jgi:FkbH-like protein
VSADATVHGLAGRRPGSGDIRSAIDEAIARQEWSQALALLRQFFFASPSLATAAFVLSRAARIESSYVATCRLAVERSFTVEPVVPLLDAAARLSGVALEVHVGGFSTHGQDLLDPGSDLYAFGPDVVLLALQTCDVIPELWERFAELTPEGANDVVERALQGYRNWISALRTHSEAALVIHNLELPAEPAMGVLDAQSAMSQVQLVQQLNRRLGELAREWHGVHVLDYDALIARHGRARWHDEGKWLTSRMPIAADCLWPLAHEYLRYLLPLTGTVAKALVIDLDNTIWGGVLGEDGVGGIQLDGEYPGAAYVAVQRALLALHARGVILAIASKNDHTEAMGALSNHPNMLLRPDHFATTRINWNDKAQSLREIADELNIGSDALAFLDDSEAERERVRQQLPEVTVIDLPRDPIEYAAALLRCPVFERLSISGEDRARGRFYSDQRRRASLRHATTSLEDYLRSLDTSVVMRLLRPSSVARVAQLTQKTNQFNVTTRRYGEAEIAAMAADPFTRVYEVTVSDRFGDSGLVGVAITRHTGDEYEIDTLLLSCRVIGRTIETAMLARLLDDARRAGARRLRGWFLATRKNLPAASFYSRHGFTAVDRTNDGDVLWELDIQVAAVSTPAWIRLIENEVGQT